MTPISLLFILRTQFLEPLCVIRAEARRLKMRKLLINQASLVFLGIAISAWYFGSSAILPALFGGAVAMANSYMLSRRLESASGMAETSPDMGVLTLYMGVVQRFLFVAAMFVVAIGFLGFKPIVVIGVFALAQIAYMVSGVQEARKAPDEQ